MFHALKFTCSDLSHSFTYIVLEESEYQAFLDHNGCVTKFTHPQTGIQYIYVCDDILPDNKQVCALINDEKLYALVMKWLGGVCYELTWTETMEYPYCNSSCVVSSKTRESKSIILTPAQYQQFQAKGGEYYPFSLANNHSVCSNNHSCFRMWMYVGARTSDDGVSDNDMRSVVMKWLQSST